MIPAGRDRADAFECKWNPGAFDPRSLRAFRELYPRGRNYLIAPVAGEPYERLFGGLTVTIAHPASLRSLL